ncbi:hypothetical protein KUTeg_001851, partial [Tegillarca granosa]
MHCSVRFAGVLNGMTTSAASVAALLSPVITSEITKNILVFRRFYTAREKKMAVQFAIHQYGVNAVSGFGDLVKQSSFDFFYYEGTREEWQIIFFICVGVAVAGSIMFAMFGSGEEQKWAKDDDDIDIEISVDEQKRKASIDNFGFRRDSFDQSLQPSEMMEIETPTSLNGKSN